MAKANNLSHRQAEEALRLSGGKRFPPLCFSRHKNAFIKESAYFHRANDFQLGGKPISCNGMFG